MPFIYFFLTIVFSRLQAMMFRLPYTWILLALLIARVSYGAFTKSAKTKKEVESCNLAKDKNILPLAKDSDTIPASNGNVSTVKSLYKLYCHAFFLSFL